MEGDTIVINMVEPNDSRVLQCIATNVYGYILTNIALSTLRKFDPVIHVRIFQG